MDKVKKAQIDPKLLEKYQHIVGTPLPQKPIQSASKLPSKPIVLPGIPKDTNVIQKNNMSTTRSNNIYIILGLLFFIVYLAFWIKFFNLKLPFSLPF